LYNFKDSIDKDKNEKVRQPIHENNLINPRKKEVFDSTSNKNIPIKNKEPVKKKGILKMCGDSA